MADETILVCDDQNDIREVLSEALRAQGYDIRDVSSGAAALETVAREPIDLVMLDLQMPGMNGLQVLAELRGRGIETPVIVMTAFGTSTTAIEAIKGGAFDYVTKPFDFEAIGVSIRRALEHKQLSSEVDKLRAELGRSYRSDVLIGNSPKMQEVYKIIGRVAPTDAAVLITGESGVGKELVANSIHLHSGRRDRPFVKVNCAALTETLLESELFGHERGSFTGAVARTRGRFELASGGTIFLDEIGEMSPALQAKVLRVLQNRTFERVGGESTLTVDIRVIASTNKDLEAEVTTGGFRQDLFYRLNVVHIVVPALRERLEDLPALVEHFLQLYGVRHGRDKNGGGRSTGISREAMAVLRGYSWPGNIRELENVIHRAVILAEDGVIRPDHLSVGPSASPAARTLVSGAEPGIRPLREMVAELEKETILRALLQTGWNQSAAAKLLGIHRRLLFTKTARYGIKKPTS